MTKKLQDFLDLQESEEQIVENNEQEPYIDYDENRDLALVEKIDRALPSVSGLQSHDVDLDRLASKALTFFEDLSDRGMNMPDAHAGKVFEVAANLLRLVMEAKNSKTEKKLKMVELQLKKARLDMDSAKNGKPNDDDGQEIHVYDRNALLKTLNSPSNQ
jgi:hypothetical protein